ncbi:MAG: PIN domain-containing protein [Methylocystis sp.]
MPGDFFDTNVLIYLASGDAEKSEISERLVAQGGAISVQVLNEFANVARRKLGFTWKEIHEFLATLRELLTVHPISLETHETGLALAERYGFSIYDAMIAASAILSGCDRLFSQDMQHGMTLKEGLRIVDPFRASK